MKVFWSKVFNLSMKEGSSSQQKRKEQKLRAKLMDTFAGAEALKKIKQDKS